MKKRISILLVLVMVLSMIPMAAFAAPTPRDFSAAATQIEVDKTTLAVNEEATITMFLKDSVGRALTKDVYSIGIGTDMFISSTRDAETITLVNPNTSPATILPVVPGQISNATLNTAQSDLGTLTFKVKSAIAGEVKISFRTASGTGGFLIGETTLNFTASAAKANSVVLETLNKDNGALSPANPVAGTRVNLRARVSDATSNPVANQTVTFQEKASLTGSWVTIGSASSNSLGYASYQVNHTKAGVMYYRAVVGTSTPSEKTVTYTALDPVKVEFVTTASVFETGVPATMYVAAYDVFGNKTHLNAPIITTESRPTGATALNVTATPITAAGANINNYSFTYTPNKDGEYVVRAAIGTAYFVEKTFTAQERGTTEKIEVTLPTNQKSIRSDVSNTLPLTINEVDAAGIKMAVTNLNNYFIYSSNPNVATINDFDVVSVADATEARTSVVTVTVQHKTKDFKASVDIPVVGKPVALKETVEVTGKDATITFQLVDSKGLATFTNATETLSINQGALVLVEQKELHATSGKGTIKLRATEYGTYPVVVATNAGIVKAFNVTFVMPDSEKPVFGAKNVILTIGGSNAVVDSTVETLDVAPFIQEGRTFVPVRFIAEAFGAEVSFTTNAQGLTETVTLTREDKVVMMTIGTPVITVVENGQTTLIPADVAPTVVSGRTVLPFRALAEAMGAEVSFGMKADNSGVAWVSFAQ